MDWDYLLHPGRRDHQDEPIVARRAPQADPGDPWGAWPIPRVTPPPEPPTDHRDGDRVRPRDVGW